MSSAVSNTFRNPILPGFNPDPSMCYVPGKGYFISTSTFEYFPGLPIYHSTDLINWKLIGHALNRRSQGVDMRSVENSAGLWAPTFRYNKGTWYMICSCFYRLSMKETGPEVISHGFYFSTTDIFDDSKWSEATFFEEIGFDQDLLFDDDGKVYQTVTRFDFKATAKETHDSPPHPVISSFISEVDIVTGRTLTSPIPILSSKYGVAEGCHILKRNGWYYLFSAEGGTQDGHRECVYRSKHPLGPYDAPPAGINPLIYNADHPDIQNTGHMDLVGDENDRWVACFLGVRPVFESALLPNGLPGMRTHLGRESFMAPMEWVDGWPVVNGRKKIELVGEFEGLTLLPEASGWEDNFTETELDIGWYSMRVPLYPCYSLTSRPGSLAIRGSPYGLDVEASPACLLRKQIGFDQDWSTEIDFTPLKAGEEAGMVVWMNNKSYASVAIRGTSEGDKIGAEIVFKAPNGEKLKIIEETFPLSTVGQPLTLLIKARKVKYNFYFSPVGSSEDPKYVGSVASETLKPLFTGVQVGIFAQGANETPCMNDAYFKYVKWVAAADKE